MSISSATIKALHKQHEKKHDEDGWWYSPRLAARFVGRSEPTIQRWRGYCPLLGRAIHTRQFDAQQGQHDYILLKDLKRIVKRRAKLKPGGWRSANDKLGATTNTVKAWFGESPERGYGKRSDGRQWPLVVLDAEKIKAIAEYRKLPTLPQAAKMLGVGWRRVNELIEAGDLAIAPAPYIVQRGKRVQLGPANLEALKKLAREGKPTGYLQRKDAQARYRNATNKVLDKYFNKPCPQLGGRVLHGRVGDNGRREWLETDLKELEPGKVGLAGQKLAAAARRGAGDTRKRAPELEPDHDRHHVELDLFSGPALRQLAEFLRPDPTEKPGRSAAAKWSDPKGPAEWARIFDVHPNTMTNWLKNQTVRNRQVSERRYVIDVEELPA